MQNEDRQTDEDSITGPRKLWGEKIHRGVFLGSIVIFSNLMILCAVIFGELQVSIFKVFGSTIVCDAFSIFLGAFDCLSNLNDANNILPSSVKT